MTNHIVSAKPSAGKSYYMTKKAVDLMKNGEKVFSNYPIIYTYPLTLLQRIKNVYRCIAKKPLIEGKQLSSFKWDDNYFEVGLHDCTIILDEAYKIVNCHNKLTDAQHDFFATTGHNNVDIYVIAQNYARLQLVIREMAMFIIISKISNPLSFISKEGRRELTPLFFIADFYLSEMDYNLMKMRKYSIFKTERVFFDINIAKAYDTQYYRRKEKPITVISWIQDMLLKDNTDYKKCIEREREEKMKNEFILAE